MRGVMMPRIPVGCSLCLGVTSLPCTISTLRNDGKKATNPSGQMLLLPGVKHFPQHQHRGQKLFLPHLHQSASHHSWKVNAKLIFCGQRAGKPQPAQPESHRAGVWETLSALSMERTTTKHKNCIFSPPEPNPSSKLS